MIVGGYELHLYCDTGNKEPGMVNPSTVPEPHGYSNGGFGEFVGNTEAECKRQAKAKGWRFARDGRVYCPRCK